MDISYLSTEWSVAWHIFHELYIEALEKKQHLLYCFMHLYLTHWGWVMHICVGKLTIIGSDNSLSPGRHQAIIRTNAGILFIGTLGTNFSEILIEIHTFSFRKMHLKMSSGRWRPFCLCLNMLNELVEKRHKPSVLCLFCTCPFKCRVCPKNCAHDFDGLVQERRNSSVLAMELRLSCTNPSICPLHILLWLDTWALSQYKRPSF